LKESALRKLKALRSGSETGRAVVGELDSQIGVQGYATSFRGIGGRVRVRLGDFRVEEVLDPDALSELSATPDPLHRYPIYLLIKEGVDTLHALRHVKRLLKCGVTYLGLKDARAQTVQHICLRRPNIDASKEIQVKGNIYLKLAGYSSKIFTRRMLVGNRFTVSITGIEVGVEAVRKALEDMKKAADGLKIPNFYGYQRFGSRRPVTHLVGRDIVKGSFSEAVTTLLTYSSPWEGCENAELRREMSDPEKYPSLLKMLGRSLDVERAVLATLIDHPGDWLKALKSVSLPLRRLFVNSYQSYIFNRAASQALKEGFSLSEVEAGDIYGEVDTVSGYIREIRRASTRMRSGTALPLIPLVGYAYRRGEGRFEAAVQGVLEEEGVSPSQFYVKQMPEVSVEGGFRTGPLIVKSLEFTAEEASNCCTLNFTLPKGSYATILLREVMKPFDPVASGL